MSSPAHGCQGYGLHSAAVQASPNSQAPPPMLTSVDEFNLKSFPLFYPLQGTTLTHDLFPMFTV